MNSIVTVFRLAILAFVIAVLVAIAVAPAGPIAASDQGVYDSTDLARVGIGLVPAAACGLLLATSLRISALVSLGVGTGCFVFES